MHVSNRADLIQRILLLTWIHHFLNVMEFYNTNHIHVHFYGYIMLGSGGGGGRGGGGGPEPPPPPRDLSEVGSCVDI